MRKSWLLVLVSLLILSGDVNAAEKKKIVLIGGRPSHGFGSHEHNAGCRLLAKALKEGMPDWETAVVENGYPADEKIFDGASAVIVYCDGGEGHLLMKKLESFEALMKKGVGLGCIHYAVEVPAGDPGNAFLRWIGGYFEMNWSVNPFWTPVFDNLPKHDVTKGVKGFTLNDEWYYHMRFAADMKGVTPILSALPLPNTINARDSAHGGNPGVRIDVLEKKLPQHVMWVYDRPGDNGRGFGYTGGHVHWSWAQDDQRMLILNAIVWVAGGEVPVDGVKSSRPAVEELMVQDEPVPAKFNKDDIKKKIEAMNKPLEKK